MTTNDHCYLAAAIVELVRFAVAGHVIIALSLDGNYLVFAVAAMYLLPVVRDKLLTIAHPSYKLTP